MSDQKIQAILKAGGFLYCNTPGLNLLKDALQDRGVTFDGNNPVGWFELTPSLVVKVDDARLGVHEPKVYVVSSPTLPPFHAATFVPARGFSPYESV